jgi:hypothetical protein
MRHPPIRFWACGDRPSMPPGVMSDERDRFGAIIQPLGKGGKAPDGWFVWERGYSGVTSAMRLPLRAGAKRRQEDCDAAAA